MGIWAQFGERRADDRAVRVGTLRTGVELHCGDPGTSPDYVEVDVPAGDWEVWALLAGDGTEGAFLVRPGAAPTAWAEAGDIVVDTGVASFTDGETSRLLEEEADEDDGFVDRVDEAIFAGPRRPYAEVPSRGGHPVWVFRFPGDGEYPVYVGLGADGQACVVAVVAFTVT